MPTVVISDNTAGADFAGVEDARIRRAVPTTNDGTGTTLEATAYDVGDDNRTVIRFTGLSNIPATATINDITLTLNISTRTGADADIDFYRCLRAWVEGEATFTIYSTANNWATLGGLGAGDVSASPSLTVTPVAGTGDKTFTSAGMIADVQAWVDGSVTNNGWLLHHVSDPAGSLLTRVYEFISSEGADGSRPRLSVDYTDAGGGGSIVLMGQACL